MKKIVLIGAVLVVLVIAALGFAAYNANSLVNRLKPTIESTASKAVGSSVHLGNLDVSVFPRVRITLDKVSVDPVTAGEEGFKLQNLLINVKLLPLLFGKLEVATLTIDSPALTLEKSGSDIWLSGLPRPEKKSKRAHSSVSAPEGTAKKSRKSTEIPAAPITFALNDFRLKNAKVSLHDHASGKTLHLAAISVTNKLELNENGAHLRDLNVSGTLLSSGKLSVKGEILNAGKKDASINLSGSVSDLQHDDIQSVLQAYGVSLPIKTAGTLSTDFSASGDPFGPKLTAKVDLTGSEVTQAGTFTKKAGDALTLAFAPDLGSFPQLKSEIALTLEKLSLDGVGTLVEKLQATLDLNASPSKATLKSKELSCSLGGVPLTLDLDADSILENFAPSRIDLRSLKLNGFSGVVEASGGLDLKTQKFIKKFSASGLRFEELIRSVKPQLPKVFTGVLKNLDGTVKGSLGADLIASLSGQISLDVKEGELLGSNIAGDVLRAITSLPFLSGSLYDSVPEGERKAIASENTAVQSMTATLSLGGGKMKTNNLKLISTVFDLDANGEVGFDANMNLSTRMRFTPQFSKALAKTTRELKGLLDSEERMVIPLVLRGIPPKFIIIPDTAQLAKTAAGKAITDKIGEKLGVDASGLGDAIGGILGGSKKDGKKKGLFGF